MSDRDVIATGSFGPNKNGDQIDGIALSDKLLGEMANNMAIELSHNVEDWILGGPQISRQFHRRCTRCHHYPDEVCRMCNGRGWWRR